MKIRRITPKDYPNVSRFWKKDYTFSKRDTKEKIAILLKKNPSLSVLVEENGEVIGTALASFDGRKGYIQKVAVREDYQGKGLGSRMVKEVIERVKRAGALDIRVNCSKESVSFYEKFGFKVKKGLIPLQIKYY